MHFPFKKPIIHAKALKHSDEMETFQNGFKGGALWKSIVFKIFLFKSEWVETGSILKLCRIMLLISASSGVFDRQRRIKNVCVHETQTKSHWCGHLRENVDVGKIFCFIFL